MLGHIGHDHGLHHLGHHIILLTAIAFVVGFIMVRAKKAQGVKISGK